MGPGAQQSSCPRRSDPACAVRPGPPPRAADDLRGRQAGGRRARMGAAGARGRARDARWRCCRRATPAHRQHRTGRRRRRRDTVLHRPRSGLHRVPAPGGALSPTCRGAVRQGPGRPARRRRLPRPARRPQKQRAGARRTGSGSRQPAPGAPRTNAAQVLVSGRRQHPGPRRLHASPRGKRSDAFDVRPEGVAGIALRRRRGIWILTWVVPVTFMIVMSWACESDARRFGQRVMTLYADEGSDIAIAIARADHKAGGNKAVSFARGTLVVLSVALPLALIASTVLAGSGPARRPPPGSRRSARRARTRDRRQCRSHPRLTATATCSPIRSCSSNVALMGLSKLLDRRVSRFMCEPPSSSQRSRNDCHRHGNRRVRGRSTDESPRPT